MATGVQVVIDCADPDGSGPRIFFQRVPEPKSVKNRVHLDVNVTHGLRGEAADERMEAESRRLQELGATRLRKVDEPLGRCIVHQDPEGNEFCVQ